MSSVRPTSGSMQPGRSRLLVDRRVNDWHVQVFQHRREVRRVRTVRASWPVGALGEMFAFAVQNLDERWIEIDLYLDADVDQVFGAASIAEMIADGWAEMLPWIERTLGDGTRARGVAVGRQIDEAGVFAGIARGLEDELVDGLVRDRAGVGS